MYDLFGKGKPISVLPCQIYRIVDKQLTKQLFYLFLPKILVYISFKIM